MNKIVKGLVALVLVLGLIGMAHAQFAKTDDAIKYRQAVMHLIQSHFKPMGAMVNGKLDYDKDVFQKNAETLKFLATLPWEAMMVPGSAKGDTTMRATVYEKPEWFNPAIAAFEASTASLAQLAATGDLEKTKAAFSAVATNCKSCHSLSRKK
jgi:cytochrome c556